MFEFNMFTFPNDKLFPRATKVSATPYKQESKELQEPQYADRGFKASFKQTTYINTEFFFFKNEFCWEHQHQ
jgi:hypothetical protein